MKYEIRNGLKWTWRDGLWRCEDGKRTRTAADYERCYGYPPK